MKKVRITCPKCGETLIVHYHTTLGHGLTDEALAVDNAIKSHLKKEGKCNG